MSEFGTKNCRNGEGSVDIEEFNRKVKTNFTREYCKSHGIKYRITKEGKLSAWSPITTHYSEVCRNIFYMTTNSIRIAIEQHVAVFLH